MEQKFIKALHQYRRKLAFQKTAERILFFLFLLGSPLLILFSLQKYLPEFLFPIFFGALLVGAGLFLAHLLYGVLFLSLEETARRLDHHLPSKDLIRTALFLHRHPAGHPFEIPLFKRAAVFLEPSPSLPAFKFPPAVLIPLAILSLGLALVSPPEREREKKISRVLLPPLEETLPGESPPKRSGEKKKDSSTKSPTSSGSLKKLLQRLKERREEHRWMKKILRDPRFKPLQKALSLATREGTAKRELEKILRDPSLQKTLQKDLPLHLKSTSPQKSLSAGDLAKILQKLARSRGLSSSERAALEKKIREGLSEEKGSGPFKAGHDSSGGKRSLYEQEKVLPDGPLSLSDLSHQLNHFSISPVYWSKIQKYFQLMGER